MRPGAGVFSAAFFALGAGLIDLVAVTKAESAMLGLMLAFLGVVQLGVVAAALARPTRCVLLAGGATSLVVLIYWWVSRSSGLLFGPAVWLAEDRLVGFTDVLGALLRLMAGLLFLVTAARGAGLARTGRWMILRTGVATALAAPGAGVLTAASLAFITGGVAPSPTVTPTSAAAGQMTTFTYCTVQGVRLAWEGVGRVVFDPRWQPRSRQR
ncbi:MAG: hypothetical protein M3021_11960 [Actinomycetota bacterium]|nr:hypothetical protein [Actinomycetota bacterium]